MITLPFLAESADKGYVTLNFTVEITSLNKQTYKQQCMSTF